MDSRPSPLPAAAWRSSIAYWLCLFCAVVASHPSTHLPTEKGGKEFAAFISLVLDLDATTSAIKRGEFDERRVAAIYAILRMTNEVEMHQLRGATGNELFLSPDGHHEAVYDERGEHVQDGVNDPTYNVFHPSEEPILHFMFDITPWIVWGPGETSVTSREERVHGLAASLEAGLRRALEVAKKEVPGVPRMDRVGEVEAISILAKAIELGEASEVVDMLHAPGLISDEQLTAAIDKLEAGLQETFGDLDLLDRLLQAEKASER